MKDHRRNIYLRSPLIYAAFQAAIEKGIIRARSVSERIEDLIVRDARRHLPAMRAAGIEVPEAMLAKHARRGGTIAPRAVTATPTVNAGASTAAETAASGGAAVTCEATAHREVAVEGKAA